MGMKPAASPVDGWLTRLRQFEGAMPFLLIPLDCALPAIQAHFDVRGEEPLEEVEVQEAAELLERCVKTGEVLTAFAVYVGGRPCSQ